MSGNIAISPTAICKQLIMDLKKHYKMHKNVKDAHSVWALMTKSEDMQELEPADGGKCIKGCSEQKMAHGSVASKYD